MFMNVWNPYYDVSKIIDEVDRLFNGVHQPLSLRSVPRGTFPAINSYDPGEKMVLFAELPGIDPDDINISVTADTLVLSGVRKAEGASEAAQYHRRERTHGEFSRSFQLPNPVNKDKVEANLQLGLLQISLPRAESDKPKQIAVNTNSN